MDFRFTEERLSISILFISSYCITKSALKFWHPFMPTTRQTPQPLEKLPSAGKRKEPREEPFSEATLVIKSTLMTKPTIKD